MDNNKNQNAEIKTIEGWEKSDKDNWDKYAKPGELVDENVYDYFLNILPPRNMGCGYLQVGEPSSHRFNPKTGKHAATYATFTSVGNGIHRYCGNCFAGQTENIE